MSLKCPALVFTISADDRITYQHCKHAALASGWCAVHAYCAELMVRAASIGYHSLYISESRYIYAGEASWFYFVQRLQVKIPLLQCGEVVDIEYLSQVLAALEEQERACVERERKLVVV